MAKLKKEQGCDTSVIAEFFDSTAEFIFKLLDEKPSDENERAVIDILVYDWSRALCDASEENLEYITKKIKI